MSLLIVLAPELTLAPTLAGGPSSGQQPIVTADLPLVGTIDPPRLAAVAPVALAAGRVDAVVPDATRFQAALDAARIDAKAPGVTFAAVRDGVVIWSGSSGVPIRGGTLTADTPMVIGSISKTFVGATVMQLVEEGRIGLDDSVRTHLPDQTWVSGKITVRQLLDHTSGLADLFNDETRVGLDVHPEQAWSSEQIFETLHEPWYKPGEGWAYANTNYHLLGLIVERVTGAELESEIRARFIEPLALASTTSLGADGGGMLPPAWATIFWASGAMSSSVVDVARWGDALIGGDVMAPATRRAMQQVNSDRYGLGVMRIELPNRDGFGHTGLLYRYTSLLMHVPKDDVTIAILVNRTQVDIRGMLTVRPGDGPSLLRLAVES